MPDLYLDYDQLHQAFQETDPAHRASHEIRIGRWNKTPKRFHGWCLDCDAYTFIPVVQTFILNQ